MNSSGSCQCGAIHYALEGDPMMTYACHCKDCQKRTGSAFSMGMIVPVSAIKVSGALSKWQRTSDDGGINTRYSCSSCGNIIYGVATSAPDILKLQPGTLDETADVKPDAHIWTRSAQKWLLFPSNAIKYDTQPESLIEVYEAVVEQRLSD